MENKDHCSCVKKDCPLHGNCKACIAKHNKVKQIPHCIFPNNNGDRSIKNFYNYLKNQLTDE